MLDKNDNGARGSGGPPREPRFSETEYGRLIGADHAARGLRAGCRRSLAAPPSYFRRKDALTIAVAAFWIGLVRAQVDASVLEGVANPTRWHGPDDIDDLVEQGYILEHHPMRNGYWLAELLLQDGKLGRVRLLCAEQFRFTAAWTEYADIGDQIDTLLGRTSAITFNEETFTTTETWITDEVMITLSIGHAEGFQADITLDISNVEFTAPASEGGHG